MINSIITKIERVVAYISFIGMVILLLMMFLTTFDVIGRSILNSPIPGAYELTEYLLVIVILFGVAYAQQSGRNVRVELFADRLPPRFKIGLDFVFTLVAFIFFVVVAWQGWEGGAKAIVKGGASDTLHIPTYPFEFLIGFGASLLSIELLLKLIKPKTEKKYVETDTAAHKI